MERFHWRQLILLIEIALLFVVGFIPNNLDWLANMLVSFVCAMQVQSFRKVHGNAYASTMCIGNMRSGMQYLYTGLHTKDRAVLRRAMQYFAVIALFAVGGRCRQSADHPFWQPCDLVLLCFVAGQP